LNGDYADRFSGRRAPHSTSPDDLFVSGTRIGFQRQRRLEPVHKVLVRLVASGVVLVGEEISEIAVQIREISDSRFVARSPRTVRTVSRRVRVEAVPGVNFTELATHAGGSADTSLRSG